MQIEYQNVSDKGSGRHDADIVHKGNNEGNAQGTSWHNACQILLEKNKRQQIRYF